MDLVLENGIEAVTFEDVAARSGVAKTTLYRHFGSKPAMVVEAAGSCFVVHATPDTGDLAEDLSQIFEEGKQAEEERRVPDLIPVLIAAGDRDPELRAPSWPRCSRSAAGPSAPCSSWPSCGARSDATSTSRWRARLVIGPFMMRRMIDRIEVTAEFRERVVERRRSRRCAPPRIGRPFPNHLWQDPRGDKGEAR